ncbi:ThuA domain-containing protein [Marinilongibacter aquaticus]|uniref:ThuA domain-containing protein n=1 Tax=Marinilongibacter aquaticus TaxID=2975157 RepID=UPI0021BD7F9C|nr:ThuA domain-containing protein [Marinilongibacter aquaticus]UBM58006.1 ThuA domain-containing protein [Marinilongibacter aquaticus]
MAIKFGLACLFALCLGTSAMAQPRFKALVLTERGGLHESFAAASLEWLESFSQKENFEFTVINKADTITKDFLSQYALFIQLDFPPYTWPDYAKEAFEEYIDEGKGAWIGFHHASLLGEFDGYSMWNWFSDFMGGIRWKDYIAERVDGEVVLEKPKHPIFKGVPRKFVLPREEWYTYDHSPRGAKVEVLAVVDENSYKPASAVKMGDHPVIWINKEKKAKNVYFQFGHHGGLYKVEGFQTLLENTVRWAVD